MQFILKYIFLKIGDKMEFIAVLRTCLETVYHQRKPDHINSLLNNSVAVETFLGHGYGAPLLVETLQYVFDQSPHFSYRLRDVIIRPRALTFLGKATSNKHSLQTLPTSATSVNNIMLFLFGSDVLSKDTITHVFFYTRSQHITHKPITQTISSTKKLMYIEQIITNISLRINPIVDKSLTQREIECLSLYLSCKTAKEIGNILSISVRTAETHITNAMKKLNCHAKNNLFDLLNYHQSIPLFFELHNMLSADYVSKRQSHLPTTA